MDKYILVSSLMATFLIPLLCAQGRNPARSMRRMLVALLAFHTLYVFFLKIVIVRYFVPEWFH